MTASHLHVHINNGSGDPPALRLSAATVLEMAKQRPDLRDRLVVSQGEDGEGVPAASDVVFAAARLSPSAARAAAPGLRFMQVSFAGVEKLLPDLPEGLEIANASGVHAAKGGEFILTAALMLTYGIPGFVEDKTARRWAPRFGPTLSAKTVLLLGTGAIGAGAARALRPTGCRIIGVSRSGRTDADVDACHDLGALEELLPQADILASSLPLTPETRGLVDRRLIDLMKHDAGVVIAGRALVFDCGALCDRLDAGTLAGAVLDVFPVEPIPHDDRLWTTPRLIITPHCSVDDHTTYMNDCLEILLDNLENLLAGRPLRNRVDPALGY